MSSFEDADTEETVTCLHMTVYHPNQQQSKVFQSLKFLHRDRLRASEVVKFGRNPNTCYYTFMDRQVSRVQFSLQLFKPFNSPALSFEIKNMSQRVSLIVDNVELNYLNKMDLPHKCIVRFGDYQFLLEREDGESQEFFEIRFTLAQESLLQEKCLPLQKPIPEYGISAIFHSRTEYPIEIDEHES
ncbi:TRAF-interacting protein with FHA domain-containing protein A [Ornithorhynchus anatinus]|uniref:TRAF-interacting protein with FHA domain-containing protein A n=1 Tax=Ornithorhynchus anatinus TaxID=9258 RepID=UPI0000EDF897|nr:TRAF-interacting protein with FHA domain-containing protein A [Ornithorhynchus anatinus]